MTPREKVRQAILAHVQGVDSSGRVVARIEGVDESTDAILTALASGSGDQIPGPDDVTAPSQMGFLSALGEAAWEQPPHTGSGDHVNHSGDATDMVDHAELARLVDDPAMDFGGFGRSRVSALLAENAALRAACSKSNDEISQTLGKALGYPWFKDDQINFPGATAENGVCVGDHVAESLADEAARRITEAERKLAEAVGLNERAADLMRMCTDPERFEGASTLNVYANMRSWLSDLPPAPGAEA
ncbi:hypothetical protein [Brevundimonas sp.]|uniref:hypothetical protein n=1 Tax=Brevundimonas sp. TaxID=1871086 RepID=UPI00289FB158|nr:hypothetical protein [Brevundimonas sp.]